MFVIAAPAVLPFSDLCQLYLLDAFLDGLRIAKVSSIFKDLDLILYSYPVASFFEKLIYDQFYCYKVDNSNLIRLIRLITHISPSDLSTDPAVFPGGALGYFLGGYVPPGLLIGTPF